MSAIYSLYDTQLKIYKHIISVDVLLKAAGDAPIMKKKKWSVDRNKRVSWISEFIKKYLKFEPTESMV